MSRTESGALHLTAWEAFGLASSAANDRTTPTATQARRPRVHSKFCGNRRQLRTGNYPGCKWHRARWASVHYRTRGTNSVVQLHCAGLELIFLEFAVKRG